MDIAVKKLELLDWVMHLSDNAMFEKLLALKEESEEIAYYGNESDDEIVGYTVLGEPLNIEQYKAKADKGAKDIEEGRYMTDEELLDDMKSW